MHVWLPILRDATLGSNSSRSRRWYLFNLSLLAGTLGNGHSPKLRALQSGGDGEERPFPDNAAGRAHRALPETPWGCGRTSPCSGPAARM